ncbi:MAG: hypothetical protein AAF988_06380 [Pseudomonadota bacterium]
MTKYLSNSPKGMQMHFNETDVQQIVNGMFDKNRTPKDVIKVKGHGRVLEITFSNKNPRGEHKTEKRVFTSNEAADYATREANTLVGNAKSVMSFDLEPRSTKRVLANA